MRENILDYLRIALYAILVLLCLLLFQAWEKDHPAQVTATNPVETAQRANGNFVPTANVNTATQANVSPEVIVPAKDTQKVTSHRGQH